MVGSMEIISGLEALNEIHLRYNKVLKDIDELVKAGNYNQARLYITALGSGLSSSYDILVVRARLAILTNNGREAQDICDRLIKHNPTDPEVYGLTLSAFSIQRLFKQSFDLITGTPAEYLSATWALERVFTEFGYANENNKLDPREAIRFAARACTDPKFYEARFLRLAGLNLEAERALRKLAENAPRRLDVHVELGLALLNSTQWHKYYDIFSRLMVNSKLAPEDRQKFQRAVQSITVINRSNAAKIGSEAADYTLPDRLLEIAYSSRSHLYPATKNKVALIGATLAAGGAERALANAFSGLANIKNYESELWLYSTDHHHGHNFFKSEVDFGNRTETSLITLKFESVAEPFSIFPDHLSINSSAIYRRILENHPSIVHAWQDQTNIEVALAGIIAGVPKIILHPHNMQPDIVHQTRLSLSYRRAYRALLMRNDVHLICVSEASLNNYLKWLGIERNERTHVVYNGFNWPRLPSASQRKMRNTQIRRRFGLANKDIVIGGAFRFHQIKRPKLWLDVAAKMLVKKPSVKFLIFGDGALLSDSKSYAERLGIEKSVIFAGKVENASELMLAFDVLLHTSQSEGLPTVLIEAQSLAVPVVAIDVGGCREAVDPKISKLVNTDKPDLLVEALVQVFKYKTSPTLANRAANRIRKKFSILNMANKLMKIYEA